MTSKPLLFLRVAILSMSCLMLTGCVYLRLLELKNQFGDFKENVELNYDQATKFILKNPILLSKDMRWLMKQEPTSRHVENGVQKWIYWLVKQHPPGTQEEGDFDVRLGMVFKEELLHEMWFPLRYQEFMSEEVLWSTFADVKHGNDNEKKMSTKWTWYTGAPDFPTMGEYVRILGSPYTRSEDESTITLTYYYDLKIRSKALKPGKHDHTLIFTFDKETSKMMAAKVTLGRLRFDVDTKTGVKIKV